MTSAAAPACPHCGYTLNDSDAAVCTRCARPLSIASQAANPPSSPVSASPYPPPPAPLQLPAAPDPPANRTGAAPSPFFASRLTGTVTQVERAIAHPPVNPARLLTACAVVAGGVPLLMLAQPPLVFAIGAAMVGIVALGVWQTFAAWRSRNILTLTMDFPARVGTHVLMVEPSGQPIRGDEVEVSGSFLAGGRFYAHRMRVIVTAESDAIQYVLARGKLTYAGRRRGALWTSLFVLLFWMFFWVAFSILLRVLLGQGQILPLH